MTIVLAALLVSYFVSMYSFHHVKVSLRRVPRCSIPFKRSPAFSTFSFETPRLNKALEEDFHKSMAIYRKEASPKKLLRVIDQMSAAGEFTANMTFIALRTLQRMNRIDLSTNMLPYWNKAVERRGPKSPVEVSTAVGVTRVFCRLQDMDIAQQIAASVGVCIDEKMPIEIPPAGTNLSKSEIHMQDMYQHILPELSLGYIGVGATYKALSCLHQLQVRQLPLDPELAQRIFKQFLVLAKPDTILQVMELLISLECILDNDSVQLITNYYFRNIDFITGAVSIPTLPEPSVPEVCFIGRSNVGKSSLINMICNRKGVAFTSKRPGKTSEFNYFAVKGVVGVNKSEQKFHIVDLPGVGFAKQRKELRTSWTKLLTEFAAQRSTLRVIYHLVDSRHGLMDADEECLSLLENLPARTKYAIVLTKVDKQRNADHFSKVLDGIVDKIYTEVAKRTTSVVPIILTSSESKYGAANMLYSILESVSPSAFVVEDKATLEDHGVSDSAV